MLAPRLSRTGKTQLKGSISLRGRAGDPLIRLLVEPHPYHSAGRVPIINRHGQLDRLPEDPGIGRAVGNQAVDLIEVNTVTSDRGGQLVPAEGPDNVHQVTRSDDLSGALPDQRNPTSHTRLGAAYLPGLATIQDQVYPWLYVPTHCFCNLPRSKHFSAWGRSEGSPDESDRIGPEREEKGRNGRFRAGRVPTWRALIRRRESPKAL